MNYFLYKNVWNESTSEYRINVEPLLITPTPVVGSIGVTDGAMYLPTLREPYYVYVFGMDELPIGLLTPHFVWIDTTTMCNRYRVLFDTFGVNGRMLPKSSVFIRINSRRRTVYFAVKKRAAAMCGIKPKENRLFFTLYYDSDMPNDIKIASIQVENEANNNSYQAALDEILNQRENDSQMIIYKNGIEVTDLNNLPTLTAGSYIDYIVDKNIIFDCNIDLTYTQENPAYKSETDNIYKQLVHIPKQYNPENEIFTYNTVDFYVRRVEGATPYGLYLHRASGQTVTQVTHNDYGIPLYILDAYRDYLDEQEISLRVVVRRHEKDNKLIEESNYLKLLYSERHTDQNIIDFLVGKSEYDIPFWKASYLETTPYVRMMFDSPNGVIEDVDSLNEYVEVLGFHQVSSILSKMIQDTVITDGWSGKLNYPYPILYTGMSIFPAVYINGKLLSPQYVNYTVTDESIQISFDDTVVTNIGDTLTTIFYLSEKKTTPYLYEISEENNNFEIPFKNYRVYMQVTGGTAKGMSTTYRTAYKEVPNTAGIYVATPTDTGYKFTFNAAYTGTKFLFENVISARAKTVYLNNLSEGENVTIPLVVESLQGDEVPVFTSSHIAVYYNGRYLVDGVDYFVNDVVDEIGDKYVREVVIQSMDHFTEDTNRVDIFMTSEEVVESSNGFEVNDELWDVTPVNMQYLNITPIHVDGIFERKTVSKGYYTLIPEGKYKTGSIWELKSLLSSVVKEFINTYNTYESAMQERKKLLDEYFTTIINDDEESVKHYPSTIVLEKKHRIYSIFLNTLIRSVLSGAVEFAADPDSSRLARAVKQFDYIKNKDIVFKGLDRKFVDYYPQYINYEISVDAKVVIDTLIASFLPKNIDPTLYSVAEESIGNVSHG